MPGTDQFDNESSLRAARKNLPFERLVARLAEARGVAAGNCLFCGKEKVSGLARRPIQTRKIDRATIAAVEAVDLLRVVEANLKLKRQGANWVCCCPFHNERTPSFTVMPAKNVFKCYGCQEFGGPIAFIRKMQGLEFVPAVEKLASDHGIQIRYETEGERLVWRCADKECASGGAELDEVGLCGKAFSADGKDLSRKEAFKKYLALAGVSGKAETLKSEKLKGGEAPTRFKPTVKRVDEIADDETHGANGTDGTDGANAAHEADGEERVWRAIEAMRKAGRVSLALVQRKCKVTGEEAAKVVEDLKRRGIVGEAESGKLVVLKLPKPRPNLIKIKIGNEEHVVDANEPEDRTDADDGVEGEAGDYVPRETEDGILLGRAALENFYAQQYLLPADDDALWFDRGLESATNVALGFVSNRGDNKRLLEGPMREGHSAEELLAAGLWLPPDRRQKKELRANAQFYGLGQLAKKPKGQRKNKGDKWIYGFPGQAWCGRCEKVVNHLTPTLSPSAALSPSRRGEGETFATCPACRGRLKFGTHVLIPYFDETGKILKLRPHKGNAPGATLCGANRIYIPRDYRKLQAGDGGAAATYSETFYKVIITEAEFKAAALWQTLGPGRRDGAPPVGVCGLPGIYFGKHYDIREELEAWLRNVGCRSFDVAFDDEDKSDKPREEQHEAIIWAKVLAASLSKKLNITGRVCVLPKSWRLKNKQPDVKGKSDWDSRLAYLVHGNGADGANGTNGGER